jgi:hypothetical protein
MPEGSADVGATTIGPYYARIRNIANELDVPLADPRFRAGMGNYVNGTLVASSDWQESEANLTVGAERALQPVQLEFGLVKSLNPLNELDDWLRPDMIGSLDIPYTDFLRDNGVSEEAIRLINVTVDCTDVRTVSALGQLRDLRRIGWALGKDEGSQRSVYAPSKGSAHYVKGGTERLTDAMAAALQEPVRTGTPVVSIEQDKSGVTVTTLAGDRFQARYAIAAVPPPALKHIRVTPGLSGSQRDAVNAGVHSGTAHFFYGIKKPFWDNDIGEPALFADTVIERVFAHRTESGDVSFLACWINGITAQQLDRLSEAQAAELVTQHLAEIRPATRDNIEYIGHYSWGRHPYIHGHKYEYGAGQVSKFANVFNEPDKRVYFAGEHCRIVETGMESAAASGERAAIGIINELA